MNSAGRYLIFVLSALPASLAVFDNAGMGPFDVEVRQLARCGQYKHLIYDTTRISKYNRTTYIYSANLSLPYGFTDSISADVIVKVFNNGNWRSKVFENTIPKMCTTLKQISGKTIQKVFESMGEKDCPLPPGVYTLKNMIVDLQLNFPALNYNKYRIDAHMKHEDTRFACVRIFLDVVPKKKS